MDEKKNVTVRSCGFTTLLAVAFIVLKLCNVITWSWLWVLAPLWIPFAIWLVVVVAILIFTGVIGN